MSRVKEYFSKQEYSLPDESVVVPNKLGNTAKRNRKVVEGQISFENLGVNLNPATKMPEVRKTKILNVIEPIVESNLPIEINYFDPQHVAFLDPKNISNIKRNITEIGRKRILRDAEVFCKMNDENIINSLVVFPSDTNLYDYHDQKEIILGGGILVLPIKRNGDWGPEQIFIYVGNFSKNEDINRKNNTSYHPNGDYSKWRRMSIGQELPVNYGKAWRIQKSVTGSNDFC